MEHKKVVFTDLIGRTYSVYYDRTTKRINIVDNKDGISRILSGCDMLTRIKCYEHLHKILLNE